MSRRLLARKGRRRLLLRRGLLLPVGSAQLRGSGTLRLLLLLLLLDCSALLSRLLLVSSTLLSLRLVAWTQPGSASGWRRCRGCRGGGRGSLRRSRRRRDDLLS